jgi:biotin-(acetyl-CoA carboxylase) ligase
MLHITAGIFFVSLGPVAFVGMGIGAAADKREVEKKWREIEKKRRKLEAQRLREERWRKRKEAVIGILRPWRRMSIG